MSVLLRKHMSSEHSISMKLGADPIYHPGVLNQKKNCALGVGAFVSLTLLVVGVLTLLFQAIPHAAGITLSAIGGAGLLLDAGVYAFLFRAEHNIKRHMENVLEQDYRCGLTKGGRSAVKATFDYLRGRINDKIDKVYDRFRIESFTVIAKIEGDSHEVHLFRDASECSAYQLFLNRAEFFTK